ncbi:MAG: DUF2066 domain-containing protein [Xanthomonadales bacterium]|jgi:hypothetical protein|nr:DUF2066 domain-containing protein [Xanthomonadales bacterium]
MRAGFGVGMNRQVWQWLLCCGCWLLALPLMAQPVAPGPELALHQAAVEVPDQSEATRVEALREALKIAAIKLAGDERAGENPRITGADPARYLQRHEYRQELYRPMPGAAPQVRLTLVASFHPASLEGLLLSAGFAIWGSDRPALLVLLNDPVDGVGRWSAFRERASSRGLKLRWPPDSSWQPLLGADADPRAVVDYARAQGASYVLTGGFGLIGTRVAGQFEVRVGPHRDPLSISADSLEQAEVELANRTLAVLSRRFAESGRAGPVELNLQVRGIADADLYARLVGALSRSSQVKSVKFVGVDTDALQLKVSVVGGSERVDQVFTGIGGFRVIDPYADPVQIEVRR